MQLTDEDTRYSVKYITYNAVTLSMVEHCRCFVLLHVHIAVLDMFAEYQPGATPLRIEDPRDGVMKEISIVICWLLNDLRGIAQPVMAKQAPAYVGACLQCQHVGYKISKNTTVYPGAIMHCSTRHRVYIALTPDCITFAV